MRVWLAGAIALCLSAAAWAAPLTEDDALRFGREASVEGLRALIVQHNPVLIYRATASWNFGASRSLPEPLEALVVEHYGDRAIQRSLLSLLARSLDKYQRYPKYRSRKLFDLLSADLKSGQDSQHYAIVIIATDLPVEAELAALLPGLDPAAANELVMFLGDRKYAPALAALQALQARIPHERNTNQMLERVDWAYLQIGTPEAMQALFSRLRALGQMKDDRAGAEAANPLVTLSRQPPGSPPHTCHLRAARPARSRAADARRPSGGRRCRQRARARVPAARGVPALRAAPARRGDRRLRARRPPAPRPAIQHRGERGGCLPLRQARYAQGARAVPARACQLPAGALERGADAGRRLAAVAGARDRLPRARPALLGRHQARRHGHRAVLADARFGADDGGAAARGARALAPAAVAAPDRARLSRRARARAQGDARFLRQA